MPQFDGLAALQLALEYAPLTPVIILTGALNEDTAVECMKAGAVDYVIKEHIKRLGQAVLHALDQQRMRRERHQAEAQFLFQANLLRNVSDGILATDLSFNIISWNAAAETIYGWRAAEVIGRPIGEILFDDAALMQMRAVARKRFSFEDDESVRDLARTTLRANGYTVLEARHGGEALSLLAGHPGRLDLLVTDVVMPEMSGRELAERLRAEHPRLKVLFMSGYTDDSVVRHGLFAAEVAYLAKPFSLSALASKVREVIDA